jgi:hypothetical protein
MNLYSSKHINVIVYQEEIGPFMKLTFREILSNAFFAFVEKFPSLQCLKMRGERESSHFYVGFITLELCSSTTPVLI